MFNTTHFAWIDFGSHSQLFDREGSGEIEKIPLRVNDSFGQSDNQMRLLALNIPEGPILTPMQIISAHKNIFAGGLFGGHYKAIAHFKSIFKSAVDLFIEELAVSDEQDIFHYLYQKYPESIHAVAVPTEWDQLYLYF
jgi:hypothetical protein